MGKKYIELFLIISCLSIGVAFATQEKTSSLQDQLDKQLVVAINDGNIDEIKKAINEGANVRAISSGFAVLHQINVLKSPEIVTLLIKAGADINAAREIFGWTPLHSAAKLGKAEAVRILIEAGADVNALDNDGNIPMQLAKPKDRVAVIRAFVTSVSPGDIQHVIPGIIALTKKSSSLGKDAGSVVASHLIPQIVREKLALAKQYLPDVPEDQLRQDIIASINRVIKQSPHIQAALQ